MLIDPAPTALETPLELHRDAAAGAMLPLLTAPAAPPLTGRLAAAVEWLALTVGGRLAREGALGDNFDSSDTTETVGRLAG